MQLRIIVITTNLHPVSHRFQDMVDYSSNFFFQHEGTCL